jgi:Mechanosensitive ion channel, beta-domain
MDLQEKRKLDYEQGLSSLHAPGRDTARLITVVTAVAFCVFAAGATVGLGGKAWAVLQPRVGSAHAAVVRYSLLLIGGLATLLFTLQLLKVPIGQLVLGGAITGILIGIAAQQTMANLFAGIVLLLSRPFHVGRLIRVRPDALGGVLDGTVTEIGITYVHLDTSQGVLALPNAQVLAAAVGPLPGEIPDQPGPLPAEVPGRPRLSGLALLVAALEAVQDATGDAPAIADLDSAALGPGADLGAALAVGGRPAPALGSPDRCLARVLGELSYDLAEPLAVPRA